MNWIVLTLAMVALTLFGVLTCIQTRHEDIGLSLVFIGFAGAVIAGGVFCVNSIFTPKEVNAFIQQKAYIEAHVATDAVENAVLTNKKIELNEWLYGAQYSKERFGGWSFYPEDIFDLTPIE